MEEDTELEAKCASLEERLYKTECELFSLAWRYNQLLKHEYTGCAVDGCMVEPDWDNTELPLCHLHLWQAARDHAKRPVEIDHSMPPAWHERQKELEAKRRSPVVYYIQMNENIKIGWTSRLPERLAAFSARPKDLLAIEPGGLKRERERHLQFKASRLDRGELFSPTPALLAHIATARKTFGNPTQFLGG